VTIEFADNTDAHRFELRSGDELLGFLVYRLAGDHITMVHTEVDPAHGGHGYAAQLAKGALDDARERGLPVVASCPYVASYVRKHPEYADLLV
jgi:predicted GNAT family acetyltransferase